MSAMPLQRVREASVHRDVYHTSVSYTHLDVYKRQAGIHADGLLKNEEIYNIFDTGKFLNRPPLVAVSNTCLLYTSRCV